MAKSDVHVKYFPGSLKTGQQFLFYWYGSLNIKPIWTLVAIMQRITKILEESYAMWYSAQNLLYKQSSLQSHFVECCCSELVNSKPGFHKSNDLLICATNTWPLIRFSAELLSLKFFSHRNRGAFYFMPNAQSIGWH